MATNFESLGKSKLAELHGNLLAFSDISSVIKEHMDLDFMKENAVKIVEHVTPILNKTNS